MYPHHTEEEIRAELAQFIGDTTRYRHPLNRRVIYTPGVNYMAEACRAYWLIDAIASYLLPGSPELERIVNEVDFRLSDIQFWTLETRNDDTAVLYCQADSDEPPAIEQEISYTDFPMSDIKIWAAYDGQHWTLYLPQEH